MQKTGRGVASRLTFSILRLKEPDSTEPSPADLRTIEPSDYRADTPSTRGIPSDFFTNIWTCLRFFVSVFLVSAMVISFLFSFFLIFLIAVHFISISLTLFISLFATLNWQLACQFFNANRSSYHYRISHDDVGPIWILCWYSYRKRYHKSLFSTTLLSHWHRLFTEVFTNIRIYSPCTTFCCW